MSADSESTATSYIDDEAIARTPEILYQNEADALYGPPVTREAETIAFEREMSELGDKMVLEIGALFDEDNIELDFTDESLEELDKLVSQVWYEGPPDDPDVLDAIVANWGAYLGQTILTNLGGNWHFRKDLDHASIIFPRTTMEVFPMHKLRKRFRLGMDHSIFDFYEAIVEELTNL
jgi:hypothetical protein